MLKLPRKPVSALATSPTELRSNGTRNADFFPPGDLIKLQTCQKTKYNFQFSKTPTKIEYRMLFSCYSTSKTSLPPAALFSALWSILSIRRPEIQKFDLFQFQSRHIIATRVFTGSEWIHSPINFGR